MITITEHAFERGKERLGLNKKSFEKLSLTAYQNGKKHADYSGSFKRYLDKIYLDHEKANNLRVYGEYIFLFNSACLITVFNLPNEYKKYK